MRRRFILAAFSLSLPISLAAVVYGCSPKAPSVQDFCGFLDDSQNCYQRYFEDIGARCGAEGVGNGPKGSFVSRDKADKCILTEIGGAVTFDKPLDLVNFPPSAVTFTVTDLEGRTCGSFFFGGKYEISASVQTATAVDGDPIKDAGIACPDLPEINGDDGGLAVGNGDNEGVVCGGTLTVTNPEGDFISLTCPGGESYNFIGLQLDKIEGEDAGSADGGAKLTGCVDKETGKPLRDLLVRYEIEGTPGGINEPGTLTVRAVYPTGKTIEYFQCTIPGALPECCNGVRDGTETDIDCGGSNDCDLCQALQGCIGDGDCSEGLKCQVSSTTGLKSCVVPKDTNPPPPKASKCSPPPEESAASTGAMGATGSTGGMGGMGGMGGAGGAGGN